MMVVVRRGEPGDLPEIQTIQEASPQAAQWDVTQYLSYELFVGMRNGRVAGFLVARTLIPGECELLNLAVSSTFRRQGVARALVGALLKRFPGQVYLEVRASNVTAQAFYKSIGFQAFTTRWDYYEGPPEAAIVMKFQSC